jgi:predicted Fe-S protein YdhL (DUF1289 family)
MTTALDSPCLGVCVQDARNGACYGCFRTPEEITRWPRATAAYRRAALDRLKARRCEAGLPPLPFYGEI